jgi:F-type H+-transporting ATPase subunit delta
MALTRSTARRYAEAAMDIAVRDGTVDEWLSSLETATEALSDPAVTRALANPALPFMGRSQAAAQLLGTSVGDKPRNLVQLLIRRGRIEQLPAVAREFRRLRDLREGIVHATVTSASPLTDDELAALRERLATIAGGRVELELVVDPQIMGGVMVRLGDQLMDGSVRGRLEQLRNRLVTGAL